MRMTTTKTTTDDISSHEDFAIIGAGLGGLGAALALKAQGFQVSVYEQASSSERFAGSINLSPNALGILDTYGIYDRIKSQGHTFSYMDFQDSEGISTDQQIFGSGDLFGYDALRIYRNTLRRELENKVHEENIPIHYGKKFCKILHETATSVTFEFADGTHSTSSVLIAADGIWSKARAILYPDIVPVYQGILAVVGATSLSSLSLPSSQSISNPIAQSSQAGSFLIAPTLPDGSVFLAGTQRKFPEQNRAGWEKLAADRAFQHAFLEQGIEHRSPLMQSAIKGITDDSMYIWALHTLPHLPRWASEKGRVVLIGDAAHAIPPTTGQGANQAFEDGYALAILLANKPQEVELVEALQWWQGMRQERVEQLLDLTRRLNNMRLPVEEQRTLSKDDLWDSRGGVEALRWLYEPRIEERVMAWIKEKQVEG